MISIVYLTSRQDPKFEWFVDSLANQIIEPDRVDVELIFVDGAYDKVEGRKEDVSNAVNSRFVFQHVKPLPNVYQGEQRKTKTEMFSPANARNTGVKFSRGSYIAFVDDVSVLMPSWWKAVKRAWTQNMTVCGAYKKHFEMVVENGILTSSREHNAGIDSRWKRGNESYPVPLSGNELYGSSFGIPKEVFNAVGGFDTICDSIGGEDYHFGVRLNFAGYKIFYDRAMYTIESEELHAQPFLMLRDDRKLSPEAYMARLREFDVHQRHHAGNWDSSHMILDLLYGKQHRQPLGAGEDDYHWFDKKPLAEI